MDISLENIAASVSENSVKGIDIIDTDDTIVFSIVNRSVVDEPPSDILVQGDNESRNIIFKIQRYFEKDDLSTKHIVIRYVTAGEAYDEYLVTNTSIEQNEFGEDILSFIWTVNNKVTIVDGVVTYDVLFYSSDNTYQWHTKPQTLTVEKGLTKTDIIPIYVSDLYEVWRNEAAKNLEETTEIKNQTQILADDCYKALDEANDAIERAEQAASVNGYVVFDVDENGHCIMTRTDNVPSDLDFAIEQGRLKLTYGSTN